MYQADNHTVKSLNTTIDSVLSEPELQPYVGIINVQILHDAAVLHERLPSLLNPQFASRSVLSQLMEAISSVLPQQGHDQTELIRTLLIGCEQTISRYPFRTAQGMSLNIAPLIDETIIQRIHLAIFREADARYHLQPGLVENYVKELRSHNLPLLGSETELMPAWMWHGSIAANIRLLVKRAAVDCITQSGFRRVMQGQSLLENMLKEWCHDMGIQYSKEINPFPAQNNSLEINNNKKHSVSIQYFDEWQRFEQTLRCVALKNQPNMLVYDQANIKSSLLPIPQMSPTALYALTDEITKVQTLFDAFLTNFSLNVFDLAGLVHCTLGSESIIAAPPIIETSYDDKLKQPVSVNAIVDGLHRCLVARRLGFTAIRTVNVLDAKFPLVPIPVSWTDVKEYNQLPEIKRNYRYKSLLEFPMHLVADALPVTEENFLYYFFRDLSIVGSAGERLKNE